jgi:hypothetical protein
MPSNSRDASNGRDVSNSKDSRDTDCSNYISNFAKAAETTGTTKILKNQIINKNKKLVVTQSKRLKGRW